MKGNVSDYAYGPGQNVPAHQKRPKYHIANGQMDPTAQLDLSTLIPPTNKDGMENYCENLNDPDLLSSIWKWHRVDLLTPKPLMPSLQ